MIERIFGVVKRHFKVLVLAQEYSLDWQSQLVSALGVLHNFILANNPNDTIPYNVEAHNIVTNVLTARQEERVVTGVEQARAAEQRDRIANHMWHDYERGVRQRCCR